MPIIQINNKHPLYPEVLDLRNRVLRRPLGLHLSEEDIYNEEHEVILAHTTDEGKVVGCLLLNPIDASTMKMRQVAVDATYQHQGIGSKLIREAETLAKELQVKTMVLHARAEVVDYYIALGYTTTGAPFTEVTIPHQAMQKALL